MIAIFQYEIKSVVMNIFLILTVYAIGTCLGKAVSKSSSTVETTIRSPTGLFKHAAVSSDGEPCSSVGVEILKKHRGSSVDAAIATMLCIGVVNFASTGIGGGFFMTIYDTPRNGPQEKIMNTILARERAPLNATEDMYVNPNVSSTLGGKAIGVPGEVKGFHEAWLKFGRVPWKVLFKSAIKLAKSGFTFNSFMVRASVFTDDRGDVRDNPELSKLLVKEDGTLVKEGDIIKRPNYAETLKIISKNPTCFYGEGKGCKGLANDIIADIKDSGGIITLEDLTNYRVYDKDPVSIHLSNGNWKVYGPRPPSSGVVLGFILNILDEYNFNPNVFISTKNKIKTLHRMVESFKFAYGKRSALGDEEFVSGIEELIRNMTLDDFARDFQSRINDSRTYDLEYYEPAFEIVEDAGTSHCSVLGPDGSAVSITGTVNFFFGSKVVGKRTGIVFNNEMDDFSTPGTVNLFNIPASPSNFIVPGKMPMSSMSPIIILDENDEVVFITGAAGGSKIISHTSINTVLALWMGLDLTDAIDFPRFHHQLLPNRIDVEADFDQDLIEGLENLGHIVGISSSTSVIQSIEDICRTGKVGEYSKRCIKAVADKRKSGKPDGF